MGEQGKEREETMDRESNTKGRWHESRAPKYCTYMGSVPTVPLWGFYCPMFLA
jgi:hypothetical protein